MSSVVISGDTSGSITLSAPAVSGSNTVTLPAATGSIPLITQGTAVSASGTSVDFLDIPSWVKRITVMLSGVSTNGVSPLLVQLGDSGGIEATGYLGTATQLGPTTLATSAQTTGLQLTTANVATYAINAQVTCTLLSASTNTWVLSGIGSAPSGTLTLTSGCSKSLSATLDSIRLTTVSGSQVFTAGTINIMYEG